MLPGHTEDPVGGMRYTATFVETRAVMGDKVLKNRRFATLVTMARGDRWVFTTDRQSDSLSYSFGHGWRSCALGSKRSSFDLKRASGRALRGAPNRDECSSIGSSPDAGRAYVKGLGNPQGRMCL